MDAGFAHLTPRHSPDLSTQSVEQGVNGDKQVFCSSNDLIYIINFPDPH
jgi:hypothetical protein